MLLHDILLQASFAQGQYANLGSFDDHCMPVGHKVLVLRQQLAGDTKCPGAWHAVARQ
jgi:hypothetical protein